MKIESYKNLIVWQKSMKLVDEIYYLTSQLPKSEIYNLITQMNRSAVSIPSNIAEGNKRSGITDYIRFLMIASGSAAELETQLQILKKHYKNTKVDSVEGVLLEVQKMLSVLIRNLKSKTYDLRPKKGFTIVELLVAISLFVVLISIISGSFVRIMRTQRITLAFIAANSNAQLSIEQMAREMRTGKNFSGSGREISFINAKGEGITYRWNSVDEAIERGVGDINFKKITADNVKVKNLNFTLFNGSPDNPYPFRVTIMMRIGAPGVFQESSLINLQTTVSGRPI